MSAVLCRRLLAIGQRRAPDFIIGGEANPYLKRWFLIPRNRLFNIYLHQFCRSDDDRALHDHPWAFNASWLLSGNYDEVTPTGTHRLWQGAFKFRWGAAPHRVALLPAVRGEAPVWTLFITGPKVRQWGFLCPKGWRHWQEFTNPADKGATVGRGCD